MLANPLIVQETRSPLPDVAAIVVDRSQSMGIENRRAEATPRSPRSASSSRRETNLEVRETRRHDDHDRARTTARRLFAALNSALADVPPERIAGAILITDGEVHDAPPADKLAFMRPLHVLIAGRRDERDRKLTIVNAARFAIVGQSASMVVRVDDFGSAEGGTADVDVRIDGNSIGTRVVPVGKDATIDVPVAHGGENVVEMEAKPGPVRTDAAEQPRRRDDVGRARPAARAAGLRRAARRRTRVAQSSEGRSLGRSGPFHHSAPAGRSRTPRRSTNCR